MPELKPCPFCGDEAIYITTAIKAGNIVKEFYSISCLGCNAEIYKYCKTEEEAVEAWNRRAEDGK